MIKILPRQTLLIVILSGFIFSLTLISYFNLKNKIENDRALSVFSEQEKLSASLPVRMKIPKLNVDATVEYVGLASNGSVDIPKGGDNVAWFNLGPRPGEVGSSVINGHSGYKNNKPAVFDNLPKLKKGDKIYVLDSKGATITFVVREFRTYNSKANPVEVFNSDDGLSHLNLVTCVGDWNEAERTHSDRLVVFTDRE